MKTRLNWGHGITIVYTLFALATLGFVAFAMTQRVDLVSDDYYEQSLQHDAKMTAQANAALLGTSARIEVAEKSLIVSIPESQSHTAKGTIDLYFAGALDIDRTFDLRVDAAGKMSIPTNELRTGAWKATLKWRVESVEYELQRDIEIK